MNDLTLVMTCGACPEQYDAYNAEGERVGYLRLRHGQFAAYRHVNDDEPVYRASTQGDGTFDGDERGFHLALAVNALGGTGYVVSEEAPE